MSSTSYVHPCPETRVTAHRQSSGMPVLFLDSPGYDFTVFAPDVMRHGPDAVRAFAEALANAAAEFLIHSRAYADETEHSAGQDR